MSTVNVCRTMERETAQQMAREHTLLHEMAHAWVAQNVTPPQMDAFMALRGLTVWEGTGAEHAAEILLWGMTEGARNIDFRIDREDTAELAAAYEILIGEASLVHRARRLPGFRHSALDSQGWFVATASATDT